MTNSLDMMLAWCQDTPSVSYDDVIVFKTHSEAPLNINYFEECKNCYDFNLPKIFENHVNGIVGMVDKRCMHNSNADGIIIELEWVTTEIASEDVYDHLKATLLPHILDTGTTCVVCLIGNYVNIHISNIDDQLYDKSISMIKRMRVFGDIHQYRFSVNPKGLRKIAKYQKNKLGIIDKFSLLFIK